MGEPRGKSFNVDPRYWIKHLIKARTKKSIHCYLFKKANRYSTFHDYTFPNPWLVANYLGQISRVVVFHPRPCFVPIYHSSLWALQSTIWTRLWLGPGTCNLQIRSMLYLWVLPLDYFHRGHAEESSWLWTERFLFFFLKQILQEQWGTI